MVKVRLSIDKAQSGLAFALRYVYGEKFRPVKYSGYYITINHIETKSRGIYD